MSVGGSPRTPTRPFDALAAVAVGVEVEPLPLRLGSASLRKQERRSGRGVRHSGIKLRLSGTTHSALSPRASFCCVVRLAQL